MANAKTDHLTVKVSRELVPRGFTWQRLPRDAVQADALGLLALVAGQDVEPAESSDGTGGRWRIARKVAPDRVISTLDPQARHTRKSKSKRRDGFRGHVAASASPRPDGLHGEQAEERLEIYGDSSYGSLEARAAWPVRRA